MTIKLTSVISVLSLLGSFVCAQTAKPQWEDFCTLRVKVESSDGRPTIAEVHVRDWEETVLRSKVSDSNGVAEFCDLGLELFEVVVGSWVCGQVIVKYLNETWPHTRELRVVYDNCHSAIGPGGCQVLIRLRDERGLFLSGQPVETDRGTMISDRYGRIYRRLGYGRVFRASIKREGYREEATTIACTSEQKTRIERTIVLKRSETK